MWTAWTVKAIIKGTLNESEKQSQPWIVLMAVAPPALAYLLIAVKSLLQAHCP